MKTQLPLQIRIDVTLQRLDLTDKDGEIVRSYPVSTSRFGIGSEEGSLRTPTGRFRIVEKIGAGAAEWMIFRGREQTGVIAEGGGDEDLILTRILWLEGIDPENSNTRERFIYIHGTNQEELIGSPASHGCVRLRNSDMIELFDRVEAGSPVHISIGQ